jgi:hypothetical protein
MAHTLNVVPVQDEEVVHRGFMHSGGYNEVVVQIRLMLNAGSPSQARSINKTMLHGNPAP